jgi:hypothetical protein
MRIISSRDLCVGMIVVASKRPTQCTPYSLWPSLLISNVDDNDPEFYDCWLVINKNRVMKIYFKSTEQIIIL